MSHVVVFTPPETFSMTSLMKIIAETLNYSEENERQVKKAYAYSIRSKSWEYGIDWDVLKNTVSFVLPELSHVSNKKGNVKPDIISILTTVISQLKMEEIMAQYKSGIWKD